MLFRLPGKIVTALMLLLIHLYRWLISPLLGAKCRFQPSCSNYAIEAIQLHGPLKGGYLTASRLLRCHPWGGFGYDPVPDKVDVHAHKGGQDE